ncbi:MAG: TetR/AcrR family transcriptional regulator [Myxococcota bacterium]
MSVSARRQRERQERRTAILDAAHKVFLSRGFDQATMDEIAAEAQLSKGTLYLYFKNKDDLFTALSTRMFIGLAGDFESLATSATTGLEAVRAMLERHAAFVLANPQHFRTAMSRMASGDLFVETPSFVEHRAQLSRIVDSFIVAIERGKRDGSIRDDLDPVQTSSQLWGAFIGTMIMRVNSDELMRRFPRPVAFDRFVEGFLHLVCNGLQSRPETDTDAQIDQQIAGDSPFESAGDRDFLHEGNMRGQP